MTTLHIRLKRYTYNCRTPFSFEATSPPPLDSLSSLLTASAKTSIPNPSCGMSPYSSLTSTAPRSCMTILPLFSTLVSSSGRVADPSLLVIKSSILERNRDNCDSVFGVYRDRAVDRRVRRGYWGPPIDMHIIRGASDSNRQLERYNM
jgi:hypothetical protein